MSDLLSKSTLDAVRLAIAEGIAMDYVDLVDVVRQKYGLEVSAREVEIIHRQMQAETQEISLPRPPPSVDVASVLATEQTRDPAGEDPLSHALRFVSAVRGRENAKRALNDLETLLKEIEN